MRRRTTPRALDRVTETAVLALAGTGVLLWAPVLIAWTTVAALRDLTTPKPRSIAAAGRGPGRGGIG